MKELFTFLPALPETLQFLECMNCVNLKVLPALPETLIYLRCTGLTGLTVLPALPETLIHTANWLSLVLCQSQEFRMLRASDARVSSVPRRPCAEWKPVWELVLGQ